MFNKAKNAPSENKYATLTPPDTRSSTPPSTSTNSARPSLSVIGGHTQVEGDINSDEDLTIEGRLSGIITCKQHTVTLGANGYINGDVFAHTLHVSGQVIGNLVVLHRATIHKGAHVSGTIVAPCLVLEDGSVFHGSIDMDPDNEVLKNAFGDITGSTPPSSKVESATGVNTSKASVDKSAAASTKAPEHEATDEKTND